MKIPEHLTLAVDQWFAQNTGLGGCSDKDVAELAGIFYEVHFEGGRESVDDALAVVESFGPGIAGLNDTYARQVLLAQEVKALRADAEQYRWLRAQNWSDGTLTVLRSADLPLGVQTFSGQLLDDAITVRRMASIEAGG